jgi:hypothetical protein
MVFLGANEPGGVLKRDALTVLAETVALTDHTVAVCYLLSVCFLFAAAFLPLALPLGLRVRAG